MESNQSSGRLSRAVKSSLELGQNPWLRNTLFVVMLLIVLALYWMYEPAVMAYARSQSLLTGTDSKLSLYLMSFLLMLACALTPLPAEIIALANAMMLSPLEAFGVTWLTAVVSAHIGYELGRLSSYNPCQNGSQSRICYWLQRRGYVALAIMRLIPVVPFFALNICGGIFKLERWKYVAITAVCIIPAVALLSYLPQYFLQAVPIPVK